MRLVRFQRTPEDQPKWGWIYQDQVGEIQGNPFGDFIRLENLTPVSAVRLLNPVEPAKIIGVGRNYVEHAKEHQVDVPEIPLIFLKPPSSVIGPNQAIIHPPQSVRVEHEAELVVVIGKTARWISPQDAHKIVLGYTIGNDVTARDLQRQDGQWTRGKGFDTFCPLGPWIETELDPADAMITCHVNGELRQMGSTRDMVFPVRQLIAFVTSVMTLNGGDVIMTGTPAGVGPLVDGDEVKIAIEGIGELVNPVRAG